MNARRFALGLIVSAVLVGLVLAVLDLQAQAAQQGVTQILSHLHYGHVAMAFALYATSYLGRALRLVVLLPGSRQAGGMLLLASISARHNLLNLLLPLRSGEASLPLMLKREAGFSLAEGTAALLVARVLDLLSVGLWCLVGLALAAPGSTTDDTLLRVGGVVRAGLFALALLRPAARVVSKASPDSRLGSFLRRTFGHLGEIPTPRLLNATLVSLGTWLLTYAACFAVVRAMVGENGVAAALDQIDFGQSLVGTTGLHLMGILPVNTVAGVGAWEAGWTAGYVLAGVGELPALVSAVVSHVVIFVFIAVLGGLGFLTRGPGRADAESAPDAAPDAMPGIEPEAAASPGRPTP